MTLQKGDDLKHPVYLPRYNRRIGMHNDARLWRVPHNIKPDELEELQKIHDELSRQMDLC